MAKLSAHKKELLRIELVKEITSAEENITKARWTRTYHSDGKILQKYDVWFKPDAYRPSGELHSFGWKLSAKVKTGLDPVQVAKDTAKRVRSGLCGAWKIISGGPAPVIISQARIMRAVQSGESIGFCRDCGHEHYGVEPDARNYTCESCGATAVYGAEEMLMG